MERRSDVAIVGGGIVGLAFAWEAARRGKSVAIFERSPRATGASIRNFGMIWPIGQVPGEAYTRAMASRERWLELATQAGVWVNECGSLHIATEADENRLIQEFAESAPRMGVRCEYLTAAKVMDRFPAVNPDHLRGGLYSPTELAVNPPAAIQRIPLYLAERYGTQIQYNTAIIGIDDNRVMLADGTTWAADQIVICSGIDFETLFPTTFASFGLRRCKLQMLKTGPQPNRWQLGTHIAGGLTLGHYRSFEVCSTLKDVKARFAHEMPEYIKYGIHVMASQNDLGEIVIGDSHEYDSEISIFDKEEIDRLILDYLGNLIRMPNNNITTRWHGVYAKHPDKTFVTHTLLSGYTIAVAPGGAGMTLSFGYAKEWWDQHA